VTLRVVELENFSETSAAEQTLAAARQSLRQQAAELLRISDRLGLDFCRAVDVLFACRGRVVVCGVGKSGLVGRKIAATFSCSGTPSFFMHGSEAAHGDLGMVRPEDVLVVISNSGATEEIVRLLPHFQELGVPIVAVVGAPVSSIARAATVVLDASVESETCPHNLVPTTSALSALAVGDALAVALMQRRGVGARDVGRNHPGGSLGRRCNGHVRDVMQRQQLPLVGPELRVREALLSMTSGRCGLLIAVDDALHPVGIVTDGDLRRALQRQPNLLDLTVSDIMTRDPVTIPEDASVQLAEQRMRRLRLKALVVVNGQNRVSGIVEVFSAG